MDAHVPAAVTDNDHEAIVAPILSVGRHFKLWAAALGGVVAWALFAWIWQLSHGLGATHLGRPILPRSSRRW